MSTGPARSLAEIGGELDTLRAIYLGSYLGLTRAIELTLAELGPDYILSRMRAIAAEFEARNAVLELEWSRARAELRS